MSLVHRWQRWHAGPRVVRWPVKVLLFSGVLVVVLYPRVWLLPTWWQRLHDLNSVLDPDAPQIAALAEQVGAQMPSDPPAGDVLEAVEQAVYARIPYAFDWETWGVMDYLPNVAEVFALGREDCDGRAVVAASLLRRLGHDAYLISDLKHTWVVVRPAAAGEPERACMSPGEGAAALAGDKSRPPPGTLELLTSAARGLSFGVAVFPLTREVLVAAALALLTLHPRTGRVRAGLGVLLLAGGLVLIRASGAAVEGWAEHPWVLIGGVVTVTAGWAFLAAGTSRRAASSGGRSTGQQRPDARPAENDPVG